MKKFSIRLSALLIMAAILCGLFPVTTMAANNDGIKSIVDSYTAGSGSFTLTENSRIVVVGTSAPAGNLLSTLQLASSQFAAANCPKASGMTIVAGDESAIRSGDIVVRWESGHGDEWYKVVVTTSNATIYYSTKTSSVYYDNGFSYNGLLYGFNFLLKCCKSNVSNTISCCTVTDEPDTKERIISLDCARKYWTLDWIKNLIREASWMGYNSLQLHMTEDQGLRSNIWRDKNGNVVLDCNGNDFNWAIGGNVVSWNPDHYEGDSSYNRDQLIEIVNLAKQYHIEIIPSVDFPTHSDAIIARFNSNFVSTGTNFSYRYKGTTYSGHTSIGVSNNCTLNVVDDYARYLVFAMIDAYADFFGKMGCNKFGLGADEITGVPVSDWANAAYTKSNGGQNHKDAFVIFVNELVGMLKNGSYGADGHPYSSRAYSDCLFGTNMYTTSSGYSRDTTQAKVPVDSDLACCFWTTETSFNSPSTLASTRTVYNCVNYYTYYVFRYHTAQNYTGAGDARDENCTQWAFNHSSAQRIYSGCGKNCPYSGTCTGTGWNPSTFKGCRSSDYNQTVTNNLGGGYFLIWGDWATLDTESNIWTRNDGYNLIDRMWSNSVKMWNWDVDSSLSFSAFTDYVSKTKTYPGFTTCTTDASIPASGEVIDRTELENLVNHPEPENVYTAETYAVYLAALTAGQAIVNNAAATQDEISGAVAQLRAAIAQLKSPAQVTITLKTKIGNKVEEIEKIKLVGNTGDSFTVELPNRLGYRFSSAENATYTPNVFGASQGILSGTITEVDTIVTVWYDNSPYTGLLEMMLENPIKDDSYTNYAAYQTALNEAKAFYDDISAAPRALTTQKTVDSYLQKILCAAVSLTKASTQTKLSCSFSPASVVAGKVAVLEVKTSENVTNVTISQNGTSVQRLSVSSRFDGSGTKLWRILFTAPATAGTYTYQVFAHSSGTEAFSTANLEVK